jgi:hypothetical protein
VVGCTNGSRGEVPGERKPKIRGGGGDVGMIEYFVFSHLQSSYFVYNL